MAQRISHENVAHDLFQIKTLIYGNLKIFDYLLIALKGPESFWACVKEGEKVHFINMRKLGVGFFQ